LTIAADVVRQTEAQFDVPVTATCRVRSMQATKGERNAPLFASSLLAPWSKPTCAISMARHVAVEWESSDAGVRLPIHSSNPTCRFPASASRRHSRYKHAQGRLPCAGHSAIKARRRLAQTLCHPNAVSDPDFEKVCASLAGSGWLAYGLPGAGGGGGVISSCLTNCNRNSLPYSSMI
jgi:hypothetical protein